eukprot:TRINITY_DN4133_c0_g1_i3.p1 TRINITY_DN4133_c0_g1~~TRINITY_DN4133_c0_g1_i3.p1  ORF type:complete len:980 (-),score=164.90 TRINITY_DN4133_c0_g1_i3:725-3664(-)
MKSKYAVESVRSQSIVNDAHERESVSTSQAASRGVQFATAEKRGQYMVLRVAQSHNPSSVANENQRDDRTQDLDTVDRQTESDARPMMRFLSKSNFHIDQSAMHPWTLKFLDQELEKGYLESIPRRMARPIRALFVLFIIGCAMLSVLYQLQGKWLPAAIYEVCGVCAILLLLSIITDRLAKKYFSASVVFAYLVSGMTVILTNLAENDLSPSVLNQLYILIFLNVTRTAFVHSILLTIILASVYSGLNVVITSSTELCIRLSLVMWLVSASQIMACYILEKYDRQIFLTNKVIEEQKLTLEQEKNKTMDILLAIYPTHTAYNMVNSKASKAPSYFSFEATTIWIRIILPPAAGCEDNAETYLRFIQKVYGRIDLVMKLFHIEKIATYGFNYTAVCGLFGDSVTKSAVHACKAALKLTTDKDLLKKHIGLQIGISTGPTYGVVTEASKKLFDIYGEGPSLARKLSRYADKDNIAVCSKVQSLSQDLVNFSVQMKDGTSYYHAVGINQRRISVASRNPDPINTMEDQGIEKINSSNQMHLSYSLSEAKAEPDSEKINEDGSFILRQQREHENAYCQRLERAEMAVLHLIWVLLAFLLWGFVESVILLNHLSPQYELGKMIVEIRFLVVFPILASLYTSYYFSWSDRNLEPKLEHIVHLLPNFLLFVYGIFVFAKSVVYLDANHSNLPVAHDAGFIVSEAFTWMVLYVSCPSSSLQKSFYVVVIWYLYYGICTVYYGKELGIDQNFMGGSTYFLTVATPSLGLFMITCIYKSILLKEELKLRLVRKFEMDRIEEKQSTIESVLMSAITPTIYEKMKDGDIELFEHHQDVALAVLDVVSFTSMTKRFLPSDMVGFASNILNYLEEVCERHDVDFIKSCGDSYLVRGSLGKSADDALKSILHFANDVHTGAPTIDMSAQAPEISFRIAVHRGSCTSGVIGESFFISKILCVVGSFFDHKNIPTENQVAADSPMIFGAEQVSPT